MSTSSGFKEQAAQPGEILGGQQGIWPIDAHLPCVDLTAEIERRVTGATLCSVEEGATPRHTRGPPNDLTRFRHPLDNAVGCDACLRRRYLVVWSTLATPRWTDRRAQDARKGQDGH